MRSNSSPPFPFQRLVPLFGPAENHSWRNDNQDEEVEISLGRYQRLAKDLRPSTRRNTLYLQAIGEFSTGMSQAVELSREVLRAFFNLDTKLPQQTKATSVPRTKWRKSPLAGENWQQADAAYILDRILLPKKPKDALIVKALTSFDLWPGDHFNFVYGLASTEDQVALSSLWRLGDFDGTETQRRHALLRVAKTVTHEVAHSFGLDHCVEYACNLNGSNNAEEGDLQPLELCPTCLEKLAWNIGFDPLDHLVNLHQLCSRWGFTNEAARFEEMIDASTAVEMCDGESNFIVSAHGDHNFSHTWIEDRGTGLYGYLDNFVGVKAVMDACFDGSLNGARVEITYGEESGMAGAAEVAKTVATEDIVVVVDVTAYPTHSDLVIEKCADPWTYEFITKALAKADFSYEIFSDCGDPICQIDETDIYKQRTNRCILLGIPCEGGDYNAHAVRCRRASVSAATAALKLMFAHLQKLKRR